MVTTAASETASVTVRNLGGIEALEVGFEPGVTVLVGRNATNRTSLLRSVAAALGGSAGALNAAAEEGDVALEVGGERYTRTFERRDGSVAVGGDPYAEATDVVDLFACLLETNPIRRAVERGDGADLHDLLLEPVDTAAIDARIEEIRRRDRRVRTRLDEIERKRSNLPALEARRSEVAAELDDVASELSAVRDTIEEHETDDGAPEGATRGGDGGDGAGRSDSIEELREVRREYERVRDDRETQEAALESLETEREEVRADLEALSVPEAELDSVEEEIERLRGRKRDLAATIDNLQSIVEFNELLVEDPDELGLGDAVDDPVEQLDPSGRTVECWTCGTAVERGTVADRLEDLREVVREKREERSELEERLEQRRSTRSDLRDARDERDALRDRLEEAEDELEDRRRRIEERERRETELRERIDDLEAEATEDPALAEDDLLEAYRRRSELAYERGQLEEQLAALDREIEAAEALDEERAELEAERADLREELGELRGRIDRLETAAVETFNEEMATVLGLLEYANVERVWIERRVTDRAGSDRDATFELHVVREDGAVYEDTVDNLSESEREVIGLVVALAGALVHDVHETVPVMVLDSLEAIDSERIAALVGHFADVAPYLLVALLPEDARALPDRYDRVAMGTEPT